MDFGLTSSARAYDRFERRWNDPAIRRSLGTLIVVFFVAALLGIELNRQALLPSPLAEMVPRNHFYAVYLAFTLLLIVEVLGLVFSLAGSVASSLGKQFEVLSLILLRDAFLEFANFGEPIQWEEVSTPLLHMLSDVTGALLVFVMVGLFYRVQRHQPITADKQEQTSFVYAKKLVALVLLFAFAALAVYYFWRRFSGEGAFAYFEAFYLLLIFSDILIVLISLRYSSSYRVVFRNSGFAVSTVMIRLALTAPPYINALLGVGSAVFAVGLSLAYNTFATEFENLETGSNS